MSFSLKFLPKLVKTLLKTPPFVGNNEKGLKFKPFISYHSVCISVSISVFDSTAASVTISTGLT